MRSFKKRKVVGNTITVGDIINSNVDFNHVIGNTVNNNVNQFVLRLNNLPNNPNGLINGDVWVDENGFLRIV
jgi:hypothetical protein